MDEGAVPIFVQLLNSPSDDVREQVRSSWRQLLWEGIGHSCMGAQLQPWSVADWQLFCGSWLGRRWRGQQVALPTRWKQKIAAAGAAAGSWPLGAPASQPAALPPAAQRPLRYASLTTALPSASPAPSRPAPNTPLHAAPPAGRVGAGQHCGRLPRVP